MVMVVGIFVGTCVRFRFEQSYVVPEREHCCATAGETRFAKIAHNNRRGNTPTTEAIVVYGVCVFHRLFWNLRRLVCICIKTIQESRDLKRWVLYDYKVEQSTRENRASSRKTNKSIVGGKKNEFVTVAWRLVRNLIRYVEFVCACGTCGTTKFKFANASESLQGSCYWLSECAYWVSDIASL